MRLIEFVLNVAINKYCLMQKIDESTNANSTAANEGLHTTISPHSIA